MSESHDHVPGGMRRVMALARDESRHLGHAHIGTEHLLLGLIREEGTAASATLRAAGAELARARPAVEYITGRGDGTGTEISRLTPRARLVVDLAGDEARRLGRDSAGSDHLLLGLLREGRGIGAGVLQTIGVDLDRLRGDVLAAIDPERGGDGADTESG